MLSVTDFVRKWIISGVRVQAGLHLDMLDADRSPNMQSAFLPELHRWISKLIARHLHACPPGDLLITMVKETVISYKKEFRKMKKRSYLSLICKRWKREMTARLPVTVSSVQTWFYMYAYVKKSSPGSTQLPTSRHLLSPPTCATMTHIHTPINRLWRPLAYGLGGNNAFWQTCPSSVKWHWKSWSRLGELATVFCTFKQKNLTLLQWCWLVFQNTAPDLSIKLNASIEISWYQSGGRLNTYPVIR